MSGLDSRGTDRCLRAVLLVSAIAVCGPLQAQQKPTREEKVRADREKVQAEGFWIYNDLEQGLAQARRSGKPLIVALRCIPCEECVKLDEDLMEADPILRPLLDQYVRVRIVATNGLDLSTFQFDFDQSFAVFLLNADKTIYARFGTRSHRTVWSDDVSIQGLAKALDKALDLHAEYPSNREALVGKSGPPLEYAAPEQYPSLAEKYASTLNYEGNVVQSCIHCHQIGDAQRDAYRNRGEAIPERVLFQYPHPKTLGLVFDPKEAAVVKEVVSGSAAADAGFRPGDEIATMQGQPMLSIADIQWVLHHAEDEQSLTAVVRRNGASAELSLRLAPGWRRQDDLSWRVSSWGLRRMTTGGLLLQAVADDDRQTMRLRPDAMALEIQHVGQYGAHAAAKRAGFQKGDVLVSFDGRTDLMRETDLLAYAATHCHPGRQVPVVVLRNGRRINLKLPMQK